MVKYEITAGKSNGDCILEPGIGQIKTKSRKDYEIRGKNLGRMCLLYYEIAVCYLNENRIDLIPIWC